MLMKLIYFFDVIKENLDFFKYFGLFIFFIFLVEKLVLVLVFLLILVLVG